MHIDRINYECFDTVSFGARKDILLVNTGAVTDSRGLWTFICLQAN